MYVRWPENSPPTTVMSICDCLILWEGKVVESVKREEGGEGGRRGREIKW